MRRAVHARPVLVHAWQVPRDPDGIRTIAEWCMGETTGSTNPAVLLDGRIAYPGWWIVMEPGSNYRILRDHDFHQLYDAPALTGLHSGMTADCPATYPPGDSQGYACVLNSGHSGHHEAWAVGDCSFAWPPDLTPADTDTSEDHRG